MHSTPEENYDWSARITRQKNVVVINIWVVTNICVHKCPSTVINIKITSKGLVLDALFCLEIVCLMERTTTSD
jgi:hypothetical protein